MSQKYFLPTKIVSYLKRLEILYQGATPILHEIVCQARVFVEENTTYDHWNGGISGHDVLLFLSDDLIAKIPDFSAQKVLERRILADLNECASAVRSECFDAVHIELADENDYSFNRSINPFLQPIVGPASLEIWKPGYIRLLISHRDEHKAAARELADALEGFGISSFVAHDSLAPMEEWSKVIQQGLFSMELLLAFITDDFYESFWTNQEIGCAVGRGIPIIPIAAGTTAPCGLVGSIQALQADLSSPAIIAGRVCEILTEKLGKTDRIKQAVVQSLAESPTLDETQHRFDRLAALDFRMADTDVRILLDAFARNDRLHKADYLIDNNNRLLSFLEKSTEKKFKLEGASIKEADGD